MSSAAQILLALALLAGCVSAPERFDDFGERVIDAGAINTCATERARVTGARRALADVTGEYLMAIAVSIAPSTPIQLRCATALSPIGDEGLLDLSCLPLLVDDDDTAEDERAPIGDALGQDNVLVTADGAFCATIAGTVPGAANPVSGSDIVTDEGGIDLNGTLVDPDLYCGTITGTLTQPFASEISGTFGAVRVAPGAVGAELPAPVVGCPTP
jgi:hypothetical protein